MRPVRLRDVAIIALVFGSIVRTSVDAQSVAAERPIDRVLRHSAALELRALDNACTAFVGSLPSPEDAASGTSLLEFSCRAERAIPLSDADNSHWRTVMYERRYVFAGLSHAQSPEHAIPDTFALKTAVLYSSVFGGTSWRAAWYGTVDMQSYRDIIATVGPRTDGSALVSVMYCLNGTGGCAQEFLHRRNTQWTAVQQRYWKQLPSIDSGYIGKGSGIDVATLHGSFGVYKAHDGNCCPSREIEIELDLRGEALVLKRYHVRPSAPP
jgi:hypothetical protein